MADTEIVLGYGATEPETDTGAELKIEKDINIVGIADEDVYVSVSVQQTGTDQNGTPLSPSTATPSPYRVFNITGSQVNIRGLKVYGGQVSVGGAIAISGQETQVVHLRDMTIANGWAVRGGGLWYSNTADGSKLTMDNVAIKLNYAGASEAGSGAVYLGANAYLNGTVVINGGSINGGMISDIFSSNMKYVADRGAAIYADENADLTISGLTINDQTDGMLFSA